MRRLTFATGLGLTNELAERDLDARWTRCRRGCERCAESVHDELVLEVHARESWAVSFVLIDTDGEARSATATGADTRVDAIVALAAGNAFSLLPVASLASEPALVLKGRLGLDIRHGCATDWGWWVS